MLLGEYLICNNHGLNAKSTYKLGHRIVFDCWQQNTKPHTHALSNTVCLTASSARLQRACHRSVEVNFHALCHDFSSDFSNIHGSSKVSVIQAPSGSHATNQIMHDWVDNTFSRNRVFWLHSPRFALIATPVSFSRETGPLTNLAWFNLQQTLMVGGRTLSLCAGVKPC